MKKNKFEIEVSIKNDKKVKKTMTKLTKVMEKAAKAINTFSTALERFDKIRGRLPALEPIEIHESVKENTGKKRGRPRKEKPVEDKPKKRGRPTKVKEDNPKKSVGRPRKNKPVREIKEGDKVRVLKSGSSPHYEIDQMIGKVCEVKGYDESNDEYMVWQSDKLDFWWFGRDELELVEE